MKILVTGGAGFIGSHIVDAFIAEGHDVAVVDNLYSGSRDNLNPRARFYEVDIRAKELGDVFEHEKPEVVDHLAAQMDVRFSLENPAFDAETNVIGSLNVLENCARHKVTKFIYASTGGAVYGEPPSLPASETCWPHPICHYGVSKYTVEHYAYLYNHLYNLRYTILRYPNIYGPRQNPHGEAGVCAILIGLMLEGKVPTLYGFGKPLRDYVYVGDIARANVLALGKANGEIVNVGSGKGTSVLAIFNTLRDLLSYPHEPIMKPLRPGEVNQIYITGARAATLLGWAPEVSLKDGLARTVEHIRAHGK